MLAATAACGGTALGLVLVETVTPALKRLGILFFALSAGCLASIPVSEALHRDPVSSGLPLDSVVGFQGICLDDGRPLRGGRACYSVALLRVTDRAGTRATAGGFVLVVAERRRFAWGNRLTVEGTLSRDKRGLLVSFAEGRAIRSEGWQGPLFELRRTLSQRLQTRIDRLGGSAATFFEALFLGITDDLPPEESYYFRLSGTIHILSLSGMHLTILSTAVLFLLTPLLGKRLGLVAASLLIVAYLFVAGPFPALMRSGIMFLVYACALLFEWKVAPLQLLAAAFLALVAVDPRSANSLSFELSFLSLFGILTLGRPAFYLLEPYLPRAVAASLAASVGASIATTPLVVACFGAYYPIGVFATLAMSPAVTVFIWGGIAYLLVADFPGIVAEQMRLGMDVVHRVIIATAEICSRAPAIRASQGYTVSLVAVMMLYLAGRFRKLRYELRIPKRDRSAS